MKSCQIFKWILLCRERL